MKNSSGLPKGTADWLHWKIGGGGQIVEWAQTFDGLWATACADIHGFYIKGPTDTIWRQGFTTTTIPASIQHDDRTWDGTYNDHSGCPDAVPAPSDGLRVYAIYDGYLLTWDDGVVGEGVITDAPRVPAFTNEQGTKGWGHMIAVDDQNPDVFLYGTQGSSVFWSDDAGVTVTDLSVAAGTTRGGDVQPTAHFTACDPTSTVSGGKRQRWVYTVFGDDIYMSTTGPGGPYSAMSGPDSPSSMFFDAFGTLWVTQDGATNNVWKWTSGGGWVNLNVAAGVQFYKVAVDPNDANLVVASGGSVLASVFYMSRNAGSTFPYRWGDDFNYLDQIYREQSVKYLDVGPDRHFHPAANHIEFDHATPGRLWNAWGSGIAYCDMPATAVPPLKWIGTSEGIEELVVQTICAIPGGRRLAGVWDMGCIDLADRTRGLAVQKRAERTNDAGWGGWRQPQMQQPCMGIGYAADNPNWVAMLQHGGWYDTGTPPDDYPIGRQHVGLSIDGGEVFLPFSNEPPNRIYSVGGGDLCVGNEGEVAIIWPGATRPVGTDDGSLDGWFELPIAGLPANGVEQGFEWRTTYMLNKNWLTYDAAGGYFYLFNYGPPTNTGLLGIWRAPKPSGPWVQRLAGAPTTNYLYSTHFRSVPGQAGHFFFTAGLGQTDTLKFSSNGCTSFAAVTGVTEVTDIGFGKEAPGQSYPSIYFWGVIGGIRGAYRSDDNFATTPVFLGDSLGGALDYPATIAGDPDVYGRAWWGTSGNGVWVSDYKFTLSLAA